MPCCLWRCTSNKYIVVRRELIAVCVVDVWKIISRLCLSIRLDHYQSLDHRGWSRPLTAFLTFHSVQGVNNVAQTSCTVMSASLLYSSTGIAASIFSASCPCYQASREDGCLSCYSHCCVPYSKHLVNCLHITLAQALTDMVRHSCIQSHDDCRKWLAIVLLVQKQSNLAILQSLSCQREDAVFLFPVQEWLNLQSNSPKVVTEQTQSLFVSKKSIP